MAKKIWSFFLRRVCLYTLILLSLLVFAFLMGNSYQLGRKGIPLAGILKLLPYFVPYTLPYTLPVALFSALLFTLNQMHVKRERLALEASGVSPYVFLPPTLFLGIISSFLMYTIFAFLIPFCYTQIKVGVRNALDAYFLEGKGENQTFEMGNYLLYVESYHQGRFFNIFLLARQGQPFAIRAKWGRAEVTKRGQVILHLKNSLVFDLVRPWQRAYVQSLSLPLPVSLGKWFRMEFLTSKELRKYIQELEKKKTKVASERVKKEIEKRLHKARKVFWERYAMSLACFSLSLLALVLGLSLSFENWLALLVVGLCVGILVYFFPFFWGRALAEKRVLPIFPGLFLCHGITLLVCLFLLLWLPSSHKRLV